MYIQKGGVKLSVWNGSGRKRWWRCWPTDFFGEGCSGGQPLRMGTTTAVTPTTLLAIHKRRRCWRAARGAELSDHFIAYMLRTTSGGRGPDRSNFHSSEKRLARTLLVCCGADGQQEQPDWILPKVSDAGGMGGTTRSRVISS